MPTQNSTQTYEMLKTYLDETADSFEKLDEEPGFLYRKTDGRTSLVFCARVDKELGFLLLSAYPGILVRTSYVPMVADYCQRITPEVGVVCVESNLCEVYYRTEVAFEHAPVSAPHWNFWSAPRSPHSRRTSALCVRSARAYCRRRSRSRRRSTFRLPPRPTRKIFCPSWRNIFKKRTLPCLQNMRPMKPARATSTSFWPRTAAGSCTSP